MIGKNSNRIIKAADAAFISDQMYVKYSKKALNLEINTNPSLIINSYKQKINDLNNNIQKLFKIEQVEKK